MARGQHGVEGHLDQRLEQDVRHQVEIIGQCDLAMAATQAFQHPLNMGLVQPDRASGNCRENPRSRPGNDPRRKGDKTSEIELAGKSTTEIECRQAQLVSVRDQLPCLAKQPAAGDCQRQALA